MNERETFHSCWESCEDLPHLFFCFVEIEDFPCKKKSPNGHDGTGLPSGGPWLHVWAQSRHGENGAALGVFV